MKLKGKIDLLSNPIDLEHETGLGDIRLASHAFWMKELKGTNADPESILDYVIGAYTSLQIPVPSLNVQDFILHISRCTAGKEFRGHVRRDWVWVRTHAASDKVRVGTLNGRVPGRLNALFKLKYEGTVYRLAHVTLLHCIGGTAVQGAEGILSVRIPTPAQVVIVRIANIEGLAHLIPLEPGQSWLVNNRIYVETWNVLYD